MTNSFDIKLLGTHRRELVPVGGPRNRRLPRVCRDTRGHNRLEVVLTFEGRGDGADAAIAETMIPQSIEASPLRGTSQANGGRCCPHSYFLKFTGDRERSNCTATAGRSTRSNHLKTISKLYPWAARRGGRVKRVLAVRQLTKRRSRTFITRPIARKTNNVADPP
jgi:hypothetical protein